MKNSRKKKNPFVVIVLLTALMALPFIAFLFDRLLLKLNNSFLLFAEAGIVSMGLFSAFLIYYFFFKN